MWRKKLRMRERYRERERERERGRGRVREDIVTEREERNGEGWVQSCVSGVNSFARDWPVREKREGDRDRERERERVRWGQTRKIQKRKS